MLVSVFLNAAFINFLSSDNFILDKEQLEFQFSKNLAILKSFERDWSQINSLCQQIGTNEY